MLFYVCGRVAQALMVVFIAVTVVFTLLFFISDPAALVLPTGSPPEVIEGFRRTHGLDRPFWEQFISFWHNAVRGDFGTSMWLGRPALGVVLERLPATFMLAVPAILIGSALGVAGGVFAAKRPRAPLSQALNIVTYALVSVAEFWLGIMFILLFSVYLGWLPSGGASPLPWVMIMPVAVLALRPLGRIFQLTRAVMTEEYRKQYVLTARAKGVGEETIGRRHVLRNASIPLVTLVFFENAQMFAGAAVVVEVVFGWPGIGRLAVGALERGDIYLVLTIAAVAAVVTAGTTLISDLIAFRLDPRTRSLVRSS